MHKMWMVCALAGLLWPAPQPARAWVIIGPRGGFVTGGGFSVGVQSRRPAIGATVTRGFFYGGGLYGPPMMGGFYGVAGAGPVFLGPPPPPIIIQRPIVIVNQPPPIVINVVPAPQGQTPASDPGRFIIITPDKAKPPVARAKPPEAPPAPKAKADPKPVDLGAPGPLPLAAGKAPNPRAEADRQIALGRAAFSEREFGRAIECFRRAVAVAPEESPAYFLMAEAQYAIGKYDEAVTSIAEGLKRRADWPKSGFRSRDLYDKIAPTYDEHIKNLRDALAGTPDDPRLLFLLGVMLWFDGQQDAAKGLFERAARLARYAAPIEALLR